jgi:hypothetical protein
VFERKKKPEVTLNWHPNFRHAESLPDIKVVRTGFVVNFIAIMLAGASLVWLYHTESYIHVKNRETAQIQQSIDDNQKVNDGYIASSKKFFLQAKSPMFVAKFFARNVSPLDVLSVLADNRPDDILYDSIFVEPVIIDVAKKHVETQHVIVTGTLVGEAADLKALNDLTGKMLGSPALKERVADPVKDTKIEFQRKSLAPSVFKFTITITLAPPAP